MPLEGCDWNEGSRLIILPYHRDDIRPAFFGYLESIEPFFLDIILVMCNVVPIAVRREGEEIEVLMGDFKGSSE